MNEISAFLIFKDTKVFIDKLDVVQTGELFKAIFEYANGGTVPVLSDKVDIIFEVFKKAIDENEKRYRAKCEKNKRYYEKRKSLASRPAKSKSQPEPNINSPPKPENEPTSEQIDFLNEFVKEFPNKDTDAELSEYNGIDFRELIKQIKKSNFLTTSNNLSLKWCLDHSQDIISGKYRDYKTGSNFSQREYTRDECNSLFQNIDDVEI